jgi:hypothetical protein
MYADEEDYD